MRRDLHDTFDFDEIDSFCDWTIDWLTQIQIIFRKISHKWRKKTKWIYVRFSFVRIWFLLEEMKEKKIKTIVQISL